VRPRARRRHRLPFANKLRADSVCDPVPGPGEQPRHGRRHPLRDGGKQEVHLRVVALRKPGRERLRTSEPQDQKGPCVRSLWAGREGQRQGQWHERRVWDRCSVPVSSATGVPLGRACWSRSCWKPVRSVGMHPRPITTRQSAAPRKHSPGCARRDPRSSLPSGCPPSRDWGSLRMTPWLAADLPAVRGGQPPSSSIRF
jgi:hypothetical protein